jgi:hypothetical protein
MRDDMLKRLTLVLLALELNVGLDVRSYEPRESAIGR